MSLGLVAYGSSDESDNDDNISPPGTDEIILPKILNNSSKDSTNAKLKSSIENNESPSPYVFEYDDVPSKDKAMLSLPPPKSKLHELDIDVKKLKSSGTVRISIPSLSQLDSEESTEPPAKKKLKPAQKGSGLFALLPSPKNQVLIPKSVGNKTHVSINKPKPVINSAPAASPVANRKSFLTEYDDSGDEEDAKDKVDFFSLEDDHLSVTVPEPIVEEQNSVLLKKEEKDNNVALKFSNDVKPTGWSRIKSGESSSSYSEFTTSYPNTQEFMSVATDDLELNEEALQQLCGRRDRSKMQGNMQLIDVSGDTIMPDSREWLTKQLTEEQNSVVQSHKRKDGPTSQQRRKHQITYLAFQAKEHELELKNQWANNRVSRKQTQAKYGF